MILTDEDIKQVYLDTFADDTPLTCTEWVAVRAIEAKVLKKMAAKHNEFESVLLQVRRALCGNIHGHDDIVELATSITSERDAALHAVADWEHSYNGETGFKARHHKALDEITTLKSALSEAKVALEDAESCMQGVIEGDYKPDSFTTQPYRLAIATINEVLGEE